MTYRHFNAIFESLIQYTDNLLQNACIIFQNSVDNFEIAQKTCLSFVWV